jgi:hypothetical protein
VVAKFKEFFFTQNTGSLILASIQKSTGSYIGRVSREVTPSLQVTVGQKSRSLKKPNYGSPMVSEVL